jgi:valyl-tRNA synthetase
MTETELSKIYDHSEVERRWYDHWEKQGYFKPRDGEGPPFVIHIPPPNVTGSLTIGHVYNHTLQDVLTRWQRMTGVPTLWLPGTDHAGIATQNVVERKLAAEGKTRHDLGREAFLSEVWKWKEHYHARITAQMRRIGDSVDWSRERFTLDEGLSRAVREVFVCLYEKGLIYRGNRIINWCPRCLTALSDEEVDHQDTDGKLYHVMYPIKGTQKHIVVATTRPETMLGDVAVAVHPKDKRYTPLKGKLAILPFLRREIPIIRDDSVDPKFGTGAVKITPAHDPNDFELGQRHGLIPMIVMNPDGTMNENAGDFRGLTREEARKRIVEALQDRGLLARVEPHRHSVGHCQRCDSIVEPYLSLQWFVSMKPLAKPALEGIEKGELTILPRRWEKVYIRWLEGIRDWCISRQLWWGHRIPVWTCSKCQETIVAVEEPTRCPKCGALASDLKQDEDVLDTWFSSWLWPFSTLGWPEQTEDLKRFYPSSVLITGPDIIFFWVARMVMSGYEFMGKAPFPVVFFNGIVRDGQGRKMSKSLGNSPDPIEISEKYGADSLRLTLLLLSPQGSDINFTEERVDLGRHFANKLWNAFRLVAPYLKDYTPDEQAARPFLTDADQWILSMLGTAVRQVSRDLKSYRIGDAAKDIYDFTWRELCDWYLEMAKPRLYAGPNAPGAAAVRFTIHRVFSTVLRLLHPFMPYLSEELWHALPGTEGDVCVTEWPTPGRASNKEVEAKIELLKEVVGAIRNLRSEMNIPPARKAAVLIRAQGPEGEILRDQADLIALLSRAEPLEVGSQVKKPAVAASTVVRSHEIFLPLEGLIDVEIERKRLERELDKVARDFDQSMRKLQNEDFLGKAKKDVVEREKSRLESLGVTKEKLERNLEVLR